MIAYKRIVTIRNPRKLVLDDLPFQPGQRVEVVLLAEEEPVISLAELQALFQDTQNLPTAQTITEEEIMIEIEAYRAEHREGRD